MQDVMKMAMMQQARAPASDADGSMMANSAMGGQMGQGMMPSMGQGMGMMPNLPSRYDARAVHGDDAPDAAAPDGHANDAGWST